MAYIGNTAASRFVSNRAASVYSGDGSTVAFTLEQVVAQDEDVLVSVDGVVQEPSVAYAVSSGTTLTFTAAPSNNAGNNIFVYYLASQAGTIGHPSSQALSATSGTFSGNIIIPNAGNIGSVGDADAIAIASDGVVNFTVAPTVNGAAIGTDTSTSLTIGDGSVQDIKLLFDGNAQDFHIGLDDSIDSLTIGKGSTLGTTTTMVIDANGIITKPLQPAFLARPSARQTNLAINTTHTIAFGTEVFDQNADFSSNTFTAPVTGKYQLNVHLLIQQMDAATDFYYINLKTSNRNYDQYWDNDDKAGDSPNGAGVSIVALADMDAGDTAYIEIIVPNSGAAQMDVETASAFSGYLVA